VAFQAFSAEYQALRTTDDATASLATAKTVNHPFRSSS